MLDPDPYKLNYDLKHWVGDMQYCGLDPETVGSASFGASVSVSTKCKANLYFFQKISIYCILRPFSYQRARDRKGGEGH